jgi:hypothetical protein
VKVAILEEIHALDQAVLIIAKQMMQIGVSSRNLIDIKRGLFFKWSRSGLNKEVL